MLTNIIQLYYHLVVLIMATTRYEPVPAENAMSTLMAAPILSPAQAAELMTTVPGARLLDVRTPGEYESVHIAGAYNVPLDTLAEHAREIQTVHEPIVLVCQSGQRARRAGEVLRAVAVTNLHVLDGGMNGWITVGQPVIRGPKRLSLERQVRIVAGSLAALGGVLALMVHPWFALLSAFVGSGLVFAGITDICGMGLLLARLPYNQPASCDVAAMVRALTAGVPPAPVGRASAASISAGCCDTGDT